MQFKEFFSPYDLKHILAYDTFQKTGCWPDGFISNKIKGNRQYFWIEAAVILANVYVKDVIEE